MSKFTPGPWAYVRNPENTRWIIDSEPAHAIACTAGFEPDNEANARLIAAAPELYEECKAMLEIIDDQLGGDFPETVREVRALLARIEGDTE